MGHRIIVAFFVAYLVVAAAGSENGWFHWVFSGPEDAPDGKFTRPADADREVPTRAAVEVIKVNAPFEVAQFDGFLKDLELASGFTFSELDRCQHTVVLSLQSQCASLSEEEISKIGVRLLNCQSHVEGRVIYACTEAMSLKECTSGMDADAWTAYHIMSNRARAVCYAARQQQFALRTELTVNKLVNSAEDHIANLLKIKEGQDQLGRLTSATFAEVSKGQDELAAKQVELRTAHDSIRGFVSENLRELSQEKLLISAVQSQLQGMADVLQARMNAAIEEMTDFVKTQRAENMKMLDDLQAYQKATHEAWARNVKDSSANYKLLNQVKHDLVGLNETVRFLQGTMASLAKGLAADSEGRFEFLIRVLPHVVVFMLAGQFLLLVKAPMFLRVTTMTSVVLNGYSDFSQNGYPPMDVPSLAAINVLFLFAYLGLVRLVQAFPPNWSGNAARTQPPPGLRNIATPVAAVAPATRDGREVVTAAVVSDDEEEEEACRASSVPPPGDAIATRGTSAVDGARRSLFSALERNGVPADAAVVDRGVNRLSALTSTPFLGNSYDVPNLPVSCVPAPPPELNATPAGPGQGVDQWLTDFDPDVQLAPEETPEMVPRSRGRAMAGAESSRGGSRHTSGSSSAATGMSSRQRCKSRTVQGLMCRNKAADGFMYCGLHLSMRRG